MSVDPIPVFTPAPDVERHWDQLRTAAESVIRSGYYILGPEEKAFEAEAAAYLGVDHAIGVNSGTDALILALRALDIGPGDEVITTAFTFFATSEGIDMLGGTTVFVDIDPVTFNIDPAAVEAAITERTKAILPVHLFGQAADMDAL
ncbi:MAG: aminotransferase class I/II-fold pyridoxal phosphate-dependent enzyme, partial [Acidimicrobiia bacterium]|nr:aminotransferase class I/II-fold pyridoxal phosphate-dependent enzyme [Acidimicrobiia bacterium]